MRFRDVLLPCAALLIVGCGDDDDNSSSSGSGASSSTGGTGGSATGGSGTGAAGGGATGGSGAGGGGPTCSSADDYCADALTAMVCDGTDFVAESCGAGQGCFQGACTANRCSDECTLSDTNGGMTCEIYDIAADDWLTPDPAASLHDRARDYEMWLRLKGLSFGGVGDIRYSDPPAYTNQVSADGLGDSAIWTGTYLASEALRLKATGSASARANVKSLVDTLHLWFNVSGDPGRLARFVAPSGEPHPWVLGDLDCNNVRVHCDHDYQGTDYDYIGHISRDQYQGVMLGYALAYEALGPADEATRALIRDDVVELVEELMTERTVPIKITYNGQEIPAFDATMRFVVISNNELDGGAIQLIVDTNNTDDSEMYGFQEFIPNLRDLLSQMPVIGGLVPTIPRAGSAIMLSSFFRVALLVTDGVPGFEATRASILDYYENHSGTGGNVDDWLEIAKLVGPQNACGDSYYGNNITMEPLYNLARLEDDPARLAKIQNEVVAGDRWALYENTKNTFFSFIYASNYPSANASVVSDAASQLAGFPVAPRYKRAVDLTGDPKYMPHEAGCTNQTDHSGAVDVADRVWADFMWQRHPWGLFDLPDEGRTAPGVDYMVAYWMGRHHGFMTDDNDTSCLRWR